MVCACDVIVPEIFISISFVVIDDIFDKLVYGTSALIFLAILFQINPVPNLSGNILFKLSDDKYLLLVPSLKESVLIDEIFSVNLVLILSSTIFI